ncbi:hypothetical protein ACVILI_001049 [Mesorhizobium sp. USDA 4775]
MSNTIREAEPGTSASKVTPLPARAAANTPVPLDHRIARNPGMKLDLGFMESVRSVNRSALEPARRQPDQTAFDQGRQPGGLAAARRRLHGSDDAELQRH